MAGNSWPAIPLEIDCPPPQAFIDETNVYQLLQVCDSLELFSLELFQGQSGFLKSMEEFLNPTACSPLGFKAWQLSGDPIALHPITPFVGTGIGRIPDLTVRDHIPDDFGKIANLVVLGCCADIEGPIVHRIQRSFQSSQVGPTDIRNMYNGSPGGSVALQVHKSRREGPGGQVVEDQIEPKSWGHPIRCGSPQIRGAKQPIGELGKPLLHSTLESP